MPVILQKNIGGTLVVLWRIDETVAELSELCGENDAKRAADFGTEKRKREWLAWHAALYAVIPSAQVGYGKQGNPELKDGGYISVSHAGGFVAVALNKTAPCGIDIENKQRDFTKVVPRITTAEERAAMTAAGYPGGESDVLLWCSKEALYKWAGERNVDFSGDIAVSPLGGDARQLSGSVRGRKVMIDYFFEGDICAAVCGG